MGGLLQLAKVRANDLTVDRPGKWQDSCQITIFADADEIIFNAEMYYL
jgi:hypothetical protein